jgi:serine/threonine-protein kinase
MESRYELLVKIAAGGMGTVYVGRLRGAAGFWRLVAVKRTHPHLLDDAELKRILVGEAQLASRIHHGNVIAVLDVEETNDELLLVMEYVEGASLAQLLVSGNHPRPLEPDVVVKILLDACAGLHAAHEAKDETGELLNLVHRDVSPHNVLVGLDGIAKVGDFGVAKAMRHGGGSATGLKGKLGYMAPEYLAGSPATRRSDVFSLGVVAWEAFAGRRLYAAKDDVDEARAEIVREVPLLSAIEPTLAPFDEVVSKALARDAVARFATVAELGAALAVVAREASGIAEAAAVGAAVRALTGDLLERRSATIRAQVTTPARSGAIDAGQRTASLGEAGGETKSAVATSVARFVPTSVKHVRALAGIAAAVLVAGVAIALLRAPAPPPAPAAAAPAPPPAASSILAVASSAPDVASSTAPPVAAPSATASVVPRHVPFVKPAATGVAPNPYRKK